MNAVLYSWLAAAAVSPFVAILSCWTLVIFRSYRSDWRLLDLFLLALTTLEGVSALFTFGYAVLGVIRPALEAPCKFLVWGTTTARTFHLSTVTSLLLDRALLSKWPKMYRTSVRQSQVRYHIVVLAIVSVFVGVTSVFARTPRSSSAVSCSLHPLQWDPRFSALLICVYGILLVTGLASMVVVHLGRLGSRGSYRTSRSDESSSSEESSDGKRGLEWTVAAGVALLSYLINHGPFLVLNALGMFHPPLWSPWMDNVVVWLQLSQGVLVPCVLLAADIPHRTALGNMLRQKGRVYRHLSDHVGFCMPIGPAVHSKPAFSPFPPAYRGHMFPQRLRWSPTSLASLQSLQPLNLDSLRNSYYGSGGYTTLLSLPSSKTSFSTSLYSSCASMTSRSTNSVTTNALEDFEFRRPSVLALFEPQPIQQEHGRRCDTPVPYLDPDINSCDSIYDQETCSLQSDEDQDRCSCKSLFDQETCSCKSSVNHEIYNSKSMVDPETCSCKSSTDQNIYSHNFLSHVSHTPRDIISKNMINIILAYEKGSSFALSDPSCKLSRPTSAVESGPETQLEDESLCDLSSLESADSSDADSVQSVIIRQRVDQNGQVSESDISIGQRKMVLCSKESEKDSNSSESRVLYSEYL